jgi:tetratricopeptide (TPR) repeat protein
MLSLRYITFGIVSWFLIGIPVYSWQAAPTGETERGNALALEQQGRNDKAAVAWRAFLKTHPDNAEAYAHLGLLEARQQRYDQAVSFYEKALALDPSFPALRLNLGLALFKNGQLRESIDAFKPLLTTLPINPADGQRLNILIGMAHYGLHEYAEAVPYLRTAAASDPQNSELRLALAHSCLWSKQYQCVLDVYREILLLNAESAEADMLAGEAEDELKNRDGAIRQFRAAAKANPAQPDVHFGLGYLLWTQHQYEEAIGEFQAELANNPDQLQAQIYMGDAWMQMNHPETALPILERVARNAPDLALPHLDLGIIYADVGRKEEALRELTTAARLTPDDVNVHWRLGRLYKSMGRNDAAKEEFAKANQLHQAVDSDLLQKMRPAPN